MKKLIFIVLLAICMISCDEGFNTQKINEKSSVPVSYSDSTKWEDAKIYKVDENKMFVKTKEAIYEVHSVDRTLPVICSVLFVLCIILLVISL